jgi:hypothetical protein
MVDMALVPLLSYPVFTPKPSTHRMHDLGSIVPYIRPKVFTYNQMSQIIMIIITKIVSLKTTMTVSGTEQRKTP